ncbi:DUF4145 domain-containing protein [Candidatus Poriferisodalis sp.]|uniref:DUF4145 domain-containing protein n=1 Tax=Candidatus Poriferisodalis sp. TaxID=3101277 RepID=UPI003B01DD6D
MAVKCPACRITDQRVWLGIVETTLNEILDEVSESPRLDTAGSSIWLARCARADCSTLAYWLRTPSEHSFDGWSDERFAAFHRDIRQAPDQGLNGEEVDLYREAAAVAGLSPRSACALLRLLLESLLKRHLADAGHSINNKTLFKLIELAEQELDLSSLLKSGLSAIRVQGNEASHDIYGISAETADANVKWLFVAIDQLIDDLYVKPQVWAELEQRPNPEEEPF